VSPLIQSLNPGKEPRVVGTIITAEYLQEWQAEPHKLPCDLVELRVDGFSSFPHWLEIGEQIESFEIPVFATIRLAREGGKWSELDSDRWPLLEAALRRLSGVDVEIHSELATLVARLADELQKLCVLSYHNFQQTPSVSAMEEMIRQAHEREAIGKIAATVNSPEDLANLRSLLKQERNAPMCLIGMGPLGRETRLSFPKEGSCFTYGYLDTPGAPGQCSAAELMAHFHS
jgi:3-dehydroquinate dehydratase I